MTTAPSLPRRIRFSPSRLALLSALSCLLAGTARSGALLAYDCNEGEGQAVKDSSGQKHDGVITGAQWTAHGDGQALVFHGPDYDGPAKPPGTFITVTDSAGLNPKKSVEIEAMVHPTQNPVAWGGIVEKGVGYGSSYRLLMLRDGKLRGAIGNAHTTVDSPAALPLDTWSKVKMSFDGKTLKLFVDDKLVASDSATDDQLSSTHPIEVGRRFTGQIDDIRVSY